MEPSRRVGFTCAGAIHTGGFCELVIEEVGGEAGVNISSAFILGAGRRSRCRLACEWVCDVVALPTAKFHWFYCLVSVMGLLGKQARP